MHVFLIGLVLEKKILGQKALLPDKKAQLLGQNETAEITAFSPTGGHFAQPEGPGMLLLSPVGFKGCFFLFFQAT